MSRRPSPQGSRKPLAIKCNDGEPLRRADLQFDVLFNIFSDTHTVFTDPHPTLDGQPAGGKVSFRDLYVNAIMRSPKATKVLKEKMQDLPLFATDFAMLALLANVGRINTTMSFFPEMKTAIRTYHPVPALQRTNGNLQDAPRIKHILKSCLLEGEAKGAPSTPSDILARARSGQVPPTSVMNLIFVLANHAAPLAQLHFTNNHDFLDIFLPVDVSSASRARAFLWLCYHYLEAPSGDNDDDYDGDGSLNPFSDPNRNPGKMPAFVLLTPEEAERENQDTEEEKALADKLIAQRTQNIKNQGGKGSTKAVVTPAPSVVDDEDGASASGDVKTKIKRGATKAKPTPTAKEKKAIADKLRRERIKEKAREREISTPLLGPGGDDEYYSNLPPELKAPILQNQYPQHQYQYQPQPQPIPHLRPQTSPIHRRISSSTPEPPNLHSHRYAPYGSSSVPGPNTPKHILKSQSRSRLTRAAMPQRTMLQHAWHVITNSDPLLDSDEELPDEHVRRDYIQRLQIISRLRGKSPTPDPEHHSINMDVDPDPGVHIPALPRPI